MVKHDNIHRIEWPLGVITAVYPDERGVIRTAEVEECGRRSIRSVTFRVPLELDCHREDDVIRQRLCDDQRGDDDGNVYSPVDSVSEAGDLGSPTTTADAEERSILHDASLPKLAVRPLAPLHSATSPLRVILGLLTLLPYLPHQPRQLSCSIQRVRGEKRWQRSLHLNQGSHDELRYVNVNSCGA